MPAQQDFLQACTDGNLDLVNTLIDRNARAGRLDRIRALTFRQNTINVAHDNNMALRCAAKNGHISIVDRLLEIPAVRENAATNNNEALRNAAEEGHISIVHSLLEIPTVRDNAAANNNEALRSAAQDGNIGIVNRLLKIPAVVEKINERPPLLRDTAIDIAFRANHPEVFTALQAKGGILDPRLAQDLVLRQQARENVETLRERARIAALRVIAPADVAPAVAPAVTPEEARAARRRRAREPGANQRLQEEMDAQNARQEAREAREAAQPGRAAAVINYAQSVHASSVHASVSKSATSLVGFYQDIKNPETVQEQIAGLQAWLNTEEGQERPAENPLSKKTPISKQIKAAIACVERLSKLERFRDENSGVSMRQALALAWMGTKNPQANGAGAAPLTEAEIKSRCESFITCLYEIQRGYNFTGENGDKANPVDNGKKKDKPICTGGSFNKLIVGLAEVGHEGVDLSFVTAETLLLKAHSLPKQIFLGLSPEKRAYYAKNWEADEIQAEFFKECKPRVSELLHQEFDGLTAAITFEKSKRQINPIFPI